MNSQQQQNDKVQSLYHKESIMEPLNKNNNNNVSPNGMKWGHNLEEVRKKQNDAIADAQTPKCGDIYEHYKGNWYKVHGISMNEEDEEIMVQYSSTEKSYLNVFGHISSLNQNENIKLPLPWCRSLSKWNELVSVHSPSTNTDTMVPRFKKITGL
jgi:hypothetical protein